MLKTIWGHTKMLFKKYYFSVGLWIRFGGMGVMIFSLPFLVLYPSNPISLIALAFGGFLLSIGGALK